jgi:hypothetical protein
MALNAANVHVGPARIFMGVTNPATGNPPTAMAHTLGVPTPGVEVGFTEGDAIFRKTKETGEIMAEQAMGPIGVYLTREVVEIEFTALERVFSTLQAAFDNTGSVNTGGRMLFWGGGSQYSIRTQTVFMSSLRPNQASKYEISVLYRAYNVSGYEIAYRKSGASSFRITLRGLFDTTRTIGDQLYQHYIEE